MDKQHTCRVATLNLLWRPERLTERLTLLAAELTLLNPDIICVQEVAHENERQLVAQLTALGYTHHTPVTFPHETRHWNLTFTKTAAVHEQLPLAVGDARVETIPAIVTVTKIGGVPVHVLNAHFVWGSKLAGYRLRQAEIIAAYAQRKKFDTTIIFTGDLNTVPESAAIRYLTGLQEGSDGGGAMWIDAWDACGQNSGTAITSDPAENGWARLTCEQHDLNPDMVPKRRIDYIFTHEWKYGGPGAPSRFGQFAQQPNADGMFISDHYGLWADIRLT